MEPHACDLMETRVEVDAQHERAAVEQRLERGVWHAWAHTHTRRRSPEVRQITTGSTLHGRCRRAFYSTTRCIVVSVRLSSAASAFTTVYRLSPSTRRGAGTRNRSSVRFRRTIIGS